MIDARISIGLPTHPKTKKLIRRIGTDGAWRLICLFLWAAQNRPDGDLSGMSAEDIELAVDWNGKPDAMVEAMLEVGFLELQEGKYKIHDWEEHNPWASGSEERSWRAKWKALVRHHGKQRAAEFMPEYVKRYPSVMQDAQQNDAASNKQLASITEFACDMQCEQQESAMQDDAERTAPSPLPNPNPPPYPLPNPNPLPKQKAAAAASDPARGSPGQSPPPPSADAERAKTLAARLDKLEAARGIQRRATSPLHPDVVAWVKTGVSDPEFKVAYDLAVYRRQQASDPSPINPKFLLTMIQDIVQKSNGGGTSPAVVREWHETASGIEAKGRELGIPPPSAATGGFPAFKARVFKAAGMGMEAAA